MHLWNISKEAKDEAAPWQGTLHESIPTQGSTCSIPAGDATAPVLSLESGSPNTKPRLSAARANVPVRQCQVSNAPRSPSPAGCAKLYFACIPGTLLKREFHSRELLQVHQQGCPRSCFLGAKQAGVIQCNWNRYLGKRLAPGVRTCFSREFPIKIKVPDNF